MMIKITSCAGGKPCRKFEEIAYCLKANGNKIKDFIV
jgi:hypothetical protein